MLAHELSSSIDHIFHQRASACVSCAASSDESSVKTCAKGHRGLHDTLIHVEGSSCTHMVVDRRTLCSLEATQYYQSVVWWTKVTTNHPQAEKGALTSLNDGHKLSVRVGWHTRPPSVGRKGSLIVFCDCMCICGELEGTNS